MEILAISSNFELHSLLPRERICSQSCSFRKLPSDGESRGQSAHRFRLHRIESKAISRLPFPLLPEKISSEGHCVHGSDFPGSEIGCFDPGNLFFADCSSRR